MTEYEVNYLISEIAFHSREITEFWLACSFAVIIAATYAPERIDKRFYRIISIGYLVSSIVFIILRIGHTMRASEMIAESPFHTGQNASYYVNGLAGLILLLLMISGTIAVLHYLRRSVGPID